MKKLQLYGGALSGNTNGTGPVSYMQMRSTIDNLSANPGSQLAHYSQNRPDLISLAQGEGSAATPDFIIKGVQESLARGETFYSPVLGRTELRQELSNYYSRIYGLNLPTSRLFVTPSGTAAIHTVLSTLLDEGDNVVAVTPIWRNLLGAIELQQASITEMPLSFGDDGKWSLDLDQLFDACTPDTKVILVTTPSNPAGWVMTPDEMKAIMNFARARDLWVVSDEVYSRLTYDTVRAPSFLDIATPDDKLFTINSFSKAWAMTGWRLGWIVGPQGSEEAIRNVALYSNFCPTTFTQFGAIEALRHGETFLSEQLALWDNNRDLLMKRFKQMGKIRAARPEATFYSLFQIEGEPDDLALTKRLIDEVGLQLAPGCSFGKVGTGLIRLCFAVSEDRLNEALDRLEKALR